MLRDCPSVRPSAQVPALSNKKVEKVFFLTVSELRPHTREFEVVNEYLRQNIFGFSVSY